MTLIVNTDTMITSDQFDPTGPAIAYGADDITVTIRAGILVGSGGDGIRSDHLSSRLINNGDINSGISFGVNIGSTGAAIVNNAGATIVGTTEIVFDTGQGRVTNHGIIKGLATDGAGVFFGAGFFTDVLTNNGLVFGRTFGVQAFGDTINNLAGGVITAYSGSAIHLGTSFLVRTAINNTAGATIRGTLAIDGSGQDCGINLNNHGLIVGAVRAGDGSFATNTDKIFNHHLIKGSVSLGVGNDLYDGHDGKVTGSVLGNAGNDHLIGGTAGERLIGGPGKDTQNGHGGADRFDFNAALESQGANADTIQAFSHVQGDKIDLVTIDATTGGINNAFLFAGTQSFAAFNATHNGGAVRAVAGVVQVDIDGNNTVDMTIFTPGVTLHAGDFAL